MKIAELKKALAVAIAAARSAGKLICQNVSQTKKVNYASQNDIKLDLDVRSQKLIEKILLKAFPKTSVLGEEGVLGDQKASHRWVIDPIDGTVNFAYGIPHACVSIALQDVSGKVPNTVVGVVYDPFLDELWTAIRGQPARLNGKKIEVSDRQKLNESVISMGFAKEGKNLKVNLSLFETLLPRIRKIRIMGSAALSLTYVASGRFDGYVEVGVRLWDIAAGALIVECAGGQVLSPAFGKDEAYRMIAGNKAVGPQLERIARLKKAV